MTAKHFFREDCHQLFNAHLRAGEPAQTFRIQLGIGTMKPLLVSFVQSRLDT